MFIQITLLTLITIFILTKYNRFSNHYLQELSYFKQAMSYLYNNIPHTFTNVRDESIITVREDAIFDRVDFSIRITKSGSLHTVIWLIKKRFLYYANNWVYTTNHKRIAVNYFLFVTLSGTCGMSLATIIRTEMAYPGVGVLAGDSLQYLSIATAHAVIMVFFMIMPLLFGAFANFLLPTQLGVHDVAFPRLNSAAFWFLPAGLLMLAQLICLDRRFQRMNCFNIREVQSLLKNKYQKQLENNIVYNNELSSTLINTRLHLNNSDIWSTNSQILSKYGLNTIPTQKLTTISENNITNPYYFANIQSENFNLIFNYNPFNLVTYHFNILINLNLINNSTTKPLIESLINLNYNLFKETIRDILIKIVSLNYTNKLYFWNTLVFSHFADLNVLFTLLSPYSLFSTITFVLKNKILLMFELLQLISTNNLLSICEYFNFINTQSFLKKTLTFDLEHQSNNISNYMNFQESSIDFKYLKLQNPVFPYNFKVGNYISDTTKQLSPQLMASIADITMGVRKASWNFSSEYLTLMKMNLARHFLYFSKQSLVPETIKYSIELLSNNDSNFNLNDPYSSYVIPTGGFYTFFETIEDSNNFFNTRLLSSNVLNQKFHRMYATANLQQKINANWRQLKFTREAWRCKLLAARHQNTLYRRYVNEDSVVWAVERNAKDVLPGWAMITPFSARTRFTAIGKVDLGLMGVFLVLNSSIVSSANFLVTYRYLSTLNNRKMRDARAFFTEGIMVASWMMIAANPMLAIGILMLLSDRHWQTSFFDYSGGGDTVLFQHMFWFFGHPEVYVIMIPTFGFNNTIISFYLRKRVSARASLLYSMYTIAFLGFFVWGHHMYMVGLAHTTRMLFSTLTVMISVPAATKLMHWCVTLVNSSLTLELPLVFQFLFIFFFVSGGISGMAVAHTGMDILFHDSFYVIGHFHVMLAGAAMFGSFGAFYFYFPAIFGVKFSRIFGYIHCIYYLIGQLMTVIPMFWLGYAGMPRRVLDYPAALGGWHAIVSAGHIISVAGMLTFFFMIFDSIRQAKAATRNCFGVSRFNTRLNFYIFEGAKTWYIQRQGWYVSRYSRRNFLKKNELYFNNHEYLETTLYSYTIVSK